MYFPCVSAVNTYCRLSFVLHSVLCWGDVKVHDVCYHHHHHHHHHCRHGASCLVPVPLCRLIRLAAGADYRTIVTRPLFSPAWLSAHFFWNLFPLSQETPEGGIWLEMWTHVPLSDLNKLYFCLQLITSEGSTKMGSHFKWNGALWEHVIERAVYCLCCQLWHKRFVPAFIWDFWVG